MPLCSRMAMITRRTSRRQSPCRPQSHALLLSEQPAPDPLRTARTQPHANPAPARPEQQRVGFSAGPRVAAEKCLHIEPQPGRELRQSGPLAEPAQGEVDQEVFAPPLFPGLTIPIAELWRP